MYLYLSFYQNSMFQNKGIRFLLLFGLFMLLIFLVWSTVFFESFVVSPLAEINASVSAVLLDMFGFDATATGRSIKLDGSSGVFIDAGCLAIEPAAIYLSSVLAFPSSWNSKWKGVLVGVTFLLLLNLLRIIGLVLIQMYYPEWFDFMHYEFFQALFLLLAVVAWFIWIRWQTKKQANV